MAFTSRGEHNYYSADFSVSAHAWVLSRLFTTFHCQRRGRGVSRWHAFPPRVRSHRSEAGGTAGPNSTQWAPPPQLGRNAARQASYVPEAKSWWGLQRRGVGTDHRFSLELFTEPVCSLTMSTVCIPLLQWLEWIVPKRRSWCVLSAATPPILHPNDLSCTFSTKC